MTQLSLATAIRRDLSTVSKWERGEMEPGIDAIVAIAEATGASIEWLATGRGERPSEQVGAR